jgi:hypothetical protein
MVILVEFPWHDTSVDEDVLCSDVCRWHAFSSLKKNKSQAVLAGSQGCHRVYSIENKTIQIIAADAVVPRRFLEVRVSVLLRLSLKKNK